MSADAQKPSPASAPPITLFDFEQESDLASWSNIDIAKLCDAELDADAAKLARAAANPATLPARPHREPSVKEPAVLIFRSTDNATSGKYSLKLVFAGGRYPTISAASPVEDWTPYKALLVDVTVSRTCLVVFRAITQTSRYGSAYNDGVSRWEAAARCEPGRNAIVARTPGQDQYRHVTKFEIYMYHPHEGKTIFVDNIRLTKEPLAAPTPFVDDITLAPAGKFAVLGTDLRAASVNDLAEQLKDKWVKPADVTVEAAEAGVWAEYERLRAAHPQAVLAILRQGQGGHDPAHPQVPFTGWEDAGIYCHPLMALSMACAANHFSDQEVEATFRFRPIFLKVDLLAIPPKSRILAAKLIFVRATLIQRNWETKPTMFVAEPCNQPWKDSEVNVFEYARDKFWNQFAGMSWEGPDADFAPVFLAHGPSNGVASAWDFAEGVRYW
jgi:hypothetical protein